MPKCPVPVQSPATGIQPGAPNLNGATSGAPGALLAVRTYQVSVAGSTTATVVLPLHVQSPAGVPAVAVTVAVRVTAWPAVAGEGVTVVRAVVVTAGLGVSATGVSEPNRPSCSSFRPAEKYSFVASPAMMPLPNVSCHRRSI